MRVETAALHRDPPGDPGRPRALGARLGDHERRDRVGRDRAAGQRRDGRRRRLGRGPLPDARRDEEQPLSQRSHRSGRRGDPDHAAAHRARRRAGAARLCRSGGPRQGAPAAAAGGARDRLDPRRHGDRAAQDPRRRRRARRAGRRAGRARASARRPSGRHGTAVTPARSSPKRDGAILRATVDGAVWITQLRRAPKDEPTFKLPAATVLAGRLAGVPEVPLAPEADVDGETWREIRYEERDGVGYLHFPFCNGAMGTAQCERLRDAYRHARARPTRVIALMGGPDFWSNGIHLNLIEASAHPADESWANINAMNDLVREIVVHRPAAHGRRDAGQRGSRRRLSRARCRPSLGARRRRAQSALQVDGESLRIGVLDLPAAAPRGRGPRSRRSRRAGCRSARAKPPPRGSSTAISARRRSRSARRSLARRATACRRSRVRRLAGREERAPPGRRGVEAARGLPGRRARRGCGSISTASTRATTSRATTSSPRCRTRAPRCGSRATARWRRSAWRPETLTAAPVLRYVNARRRRAVEPSSLRAADGRSARLAAQGAGPSTQELENEIDRYRGGGCRRIARSRNCQCAGWRGARRRAAAA